MGDENRMRCGATGQLLPPGMCPKCRACFGPGEPISCSEEVHARCLRFDDPEQVAALRADLARRPETPGEEIARLREENAQLRLGVAKLKATVAATRHIILIHQDKEKACRDVMELVARRLGSVETQGEADILAATIEENERLRISNRKSSAGLSHQHAMIEVMRAALEEIAKEDGTPYGTIALKALEGGS